MSELKVRRVRVLKRKKSRALPMSSVAAISVLAIAIIAVMAFAVAVPVAASKEICPHKSYGRISLLIGNATGNFTYPANTPFYVAHGYIWSGWSTETHANKTAIKGPTTYFELSVDGMVQDSKVRMIYTHDTDRMDQMFVSQYGDGMTGTHNFTGRWYADGSLIGGTPGQAELQFILVSIVTFI